MIKRPFAVIVFFFISGILLGRFLPVQVEFIHISILVLVFILSSFIFSRHQSISNGFLILSVVFFATLLFLNSNVFPKEHISHFLKKDRLKESMVGIIKSPILVRNPYFGKISSTYLFEIEAIKSEENWQKVRGLCYVRIQGERGYKYGDRLLVRGSIRRPKGSVIARAKPEAMTEIASSSAKKHGGLLAMTRSEFNYREYLERQNVFAIINTKDYNVSLLSYNYKSNPVLKYTYLIREKLKQQIIEKMPIDSGVFFRAILLGDRSELRKDVQTSFKNSGTMHILAISGLHVTLIAMVIIYLLRFLRVKREVLYVFTIVFLIFYALFTLSSPSVVRAVVMVCIFLLGKLLGKRTDTYNSLGLAALFILIKNPKDLFNVGFQLSFLAVVFILFFVPLFMKLVEGNKNLYFKKYIYAPLAVSLAAWVGTFPLIFYYFGLITPVAIIANLFIVPFLLVVLVGGLFFLLFGWIGFVGTILAGLNDFCTEILFSMTDFFASLRYGHFYLG